jgi:aminoglycoside phosphotransferase (APT) family kinase protein
VGYVYIPGHGATGRTLDLAWRQRVAVRLAEFLRALHAIAPVDLSVAAPPLDHLNRLDTRKRRATTESRLTFLVSVGAIHDARPILAILDSSPEPSASGRLVVAHGDLHVGQLLLTAHGDLAGIVDWGDLHLGGAAVDLAAVHQLLPRSLHNTFLATYGPVDAESWELARARAAWHAVALLAAAVDTGNVPLANEVKRALAFIVQET